jgi:spoIIIJ-associated protein
VEWVETTGKSVEEAKDAALDELGVDEVDAEFEILEEPRQGLFGRQRGEARVRARVRPTAPRPKADRRDRKRRKPSERGAASNIRSENGAAEDEAGAVEVDVDGRGAGSNPPATSTGGRRRRGGGRAKTVDGPRRAAAADQDEPGQDGPDQDEDAMDDAGRPPVAIGNGGTSVVEEELSLTEQGEIAEEFLVGLLERFGAPAQTTVVTIDEETIEVQVSGSELGLLIGPKGQTLQAVQELTRTAVQRRSVARTGRILVDVAGYRVRRREALERFTRQVAEDVTASGVQRALEPMTAADRKVVHDTANDIPGVRTISEGEDPRRRVVIIPDSGSDVGDSATEDDSNTESGDEG